MIKIISRTSLIFLFSLLILACTPHPGTGVWKAISDNEMGISRLIVGFDGRAEFVSKKQDNATWHCFWGKVTDKKLDFECTPSTNPEQKKSFVLSIDDQGLASLYHKANLLATFSRLDENPSPRK
jgi:hypothetical protein